jgi:hypothetical protein
VTINSLWATLGDQYVSYGYTLKNTDGFVKDIQYMLSSLKTPDLVYYTDSYASKSISLEEEVKSNSMSSLLYGLGEAIYNDNKYPKEKDIMKRVDSTIEKNAQNYASSFIASSWKFNKTNCEMMMEGKWTELFDLWNDYYWRSYSRQSLLISTTQSSSTSHASTYTTSIIPTSTIIPTKVTTQT